MPLDLDTAAKAHIDWLGHFMQALQLNHISAELRRETQGDGCLFSQWLEDVAATQGYDPAGLRQVDACHRAMHELGSALLAFERTDEDYYAALRHFCHTAVEFNRLVAKLDQRTSALCRSA